MCMSVILSIAKRVHTARLVRLPPYRSEYYQSYRCMMILQLRNFHAALAVILVACGQAAMIDLQEIESETGVCLSAVEREKVLSGLRQNITASYEVHSSTTVTTMPTEPLTTDQISTTTASTTVTTLSPHPAIYSCNGTTGWRRIAFINMTNTSYSCPSGLVLTSYSKRTCVKA